MTLADDLDLEEYITAKDDLSGADIKVYSVQLLNCSLVQCNYWNCGCSYMFTYTPLWSHISAISWVVFHTTDATGLIFP